jgi:hypothetical protein
MGGCAEAERWIAEAERWVADSNVNDTKTEVQMFRYQSLLSERNQNVLMCSKKGSRTFLFSPKTWKRNNNVFMCTRTF